MTLVKLYNKVQESVIKDLMGNNINKVSTSESIYDTAMKLILSDLKNIEGKVNINLDKFGFDISYELPHKILILILVRNYDINKKMGLDTTAVSIRTDLTPLDKNIKSSIESVIPLKSRAIDLNNAINKIVKFIKGIEDYIKL
jgi:CII-binding regulator of phage lambda lysogenization HflD